MQTKKKYSILFLILIYSCNQINNKQIKQIVIDGFILLEVPNTYSFVSEKGIDSYPFTLQNDKGLTLKGDLGYFPDNLDKTLIVLDIKLKDSILRRIGNTFDSNVIFFSEYPKEDKNEGIFQKEYYLYDTINGIIVKKIYPKHIGIGITGIYIPKLKDNRSFSLYGKNLDSEQNRIVQNIFKTIQYKD